MATLHQIHLPDDLLAAIKRRAEERGISIEEQLIRELSQGQNAPSAENEQALLTQIRAERNAMAAEGIQLTDELLNEAKNWGRE
jgi:hypothetical protein